MATVIEGDEVERHCAIKVFRPSSVTLLRPFPTNKTFFLGCGLLEEIVFLESSSSDSSKLGGWKMLAGVVDALSCFLVTGCTRRSDVVFSAAGCAYCASGR